MFPRLSHRTVMDSALATVLLTVALAGMWSMESHAFRAELRPEVHSQWPTETTLVPGAGKFHCLLFVHPHCPCSRAALAVVKQHMAQAGAVVDWQIVFVQPPEVSSDWHIGSNWQRAEELSNARCALDPDGRNAQAFGAAASGHCFVFDSQGRKLFDGGLTAGRGMEGLCLGQKVLASLHDSSSTLKPHSAPVYGCRLSGSSE